MLPGAAAADARVTRADGRDGWLLREIGSGFTALVGADGATEHALAGVAVGDFALAVVAVAPADARAPEPAPAPARATLVDIDGAVAGRYDLRAGTVVLLRPDAHVCARWRAATPAQVECAMRRALALEEPTRCR